MAKIKDIVARQIFDSRGNPTVEVDVITENLILGRAAVPSGASTGEHEAVELRDGGNDYHGKGVLKAVSNINDILSKELIGNSVFDQISNDHLMIKIDGTENKSKLGANAILGVSLAMAKAAAKEKNLSLFKYLGSESNLLPVPMMNIINGGSHSDAPIAFQEFMIMPVSADSFTDAMKMGSEIFHSLKKVLKSRGLSTSVGDEGGFAPKLNGTEDALETIQKAVTNSGYKFGEDVMIALDCASAEFYKDGYYDYRIFEGPKAQIRNSKQQADYLAELSKKYPIISIEDGMDENDWDGWKYLTEIIGKNGILIENINAKKIAKNLKKLMGNDNLLKKFQTKSWDNFKLNSQLISSRLDQYRSELFFKN